MCYMYKKYWLHMNELMTYTFHILMNIIDRWCQPISVIWVICELVTHDIGIHTAQYMFATLCKLHPLLPWTSKGYRLYFCCNNRLNQILSRFVQYNIINVRDGHSFFDHSGRMIVVYMSLVRDYHWLPLFSISLGYFLCT